MVTKADKLRFLEGLKRLLDEHGAQIQVSATWEHREPVADMEVHFQAGGMIDFSISTTNDEINIEAEEVDTIMAHVEGGA